MTGGTGGRQWGTRNSERESGSEPTIPPTDRPSETRHRALALAAWGLAEATLFFIVPDVLLTRLALRSGRRAIVACGWTLAGALAGGLVMYGWGAGDPDRAMRVLDAVPAIDREMIERVGVEIADDAAAMLLGPLGGVPYKIYAVQAGRHNVSVPLFLLISIPARGIRFVLTALIASAIATVVRRRFSQAACDRLHAVFWVGLYAWYFWHFGW